VFEGVTFQSHLDGSYHLFTPEKVIDIQRAIGSDFMMMLDVCPASDGTKESIKNAVSLTSDWAQKGMKYFNDTSHYYNHKQSLLPIVQGGTDFSLRQQSVNEICKLDAHAYAIGGLAVGEPKDEMLSTVEFMNQLLPKDKPRYLMGVGTPADLVRCITGISSRHNTIKHIDSQINASY
jgi:queuine tRNA-ribosyltransferase